MTNMAQIEVAMFESVTAKSKSLPIIGKQERPRRECRARKRPFDFDAYSSKRLKYDAFDLDESMENSSCTFALGSDSEEENDTESKCSTNDETDPTLSQRKFDENSDIEELDEEIFPAHLSKVCSDQQRHVPVVLNDPVHHQQQNISRHSNRLMGQFKYLYNHGLRKAVQPTLCPEENLSGSASNELRWELRNTFNRLDLFKEGYCVLSNEPFSFYSLCYMCGSMGSDLIYCNSCCEAFHRTCLNDNERPRLHPPPDSWLCPKCNVCTICGLLTHRSSSINGDGSSLMLSCYDCQRNFHLKCLKKFPEDQWNEMTQTFNSSNQTIISQSRLTHSYCLNQIWSCPSCVKCDCGQELISNERNLLSLPKNLLAQQSLMCTDCLNHFKFLRLHKNDQIDQCHFCEKYLEQILIKSQQHLLLQCAKCQHRFHPKCDGFRSEDPLLFSHLTRNSSIAIVCSKCDLDQRNQIQKLFLDYKIQTMQTVVGNVLTIFKRILTDENQWNKLEIVLVKLQHLHESRQRLLNLHAFLNDFFLLVRRDFSSHEMSRWQSTLDGCVLRQCPWFKSSTFLSNCSSISQQRISLPSPSIDHNYFSTNVSTTISESNRKKSPYAAPSDSLLRYLEENFVDSFDNFHQDDQRKCQLCETFSDHSSANIGRLISFGLNQWVHVGCILPAYAKNLDQPPYILRNIRETIVRCQTKYTCAICSKLGASVHCFENECYQRFHCQCIEKYYSNVDAQQRQQLNIKNGFLPNMTTLCLRHNGLKNQQKVHRDSAELLNDEQSKENATPSPPKIKSVNISSTVYGDLSNALIDFGLTNTRLCIGSLQIESLGNFDYLVDSPIHALSIHQNYPDQYRASRLFWSTTNPRQKTAYYLHIDIEQTYHQDPRQHNTVTHPIPEEIQLQEQVYQNCREYFEKYQKQIDDHLTKIEEFCQRTMVHKKGKGGDLANGSTNNSSRKKANQTGSVGTTKRLTKATPSCVKRQTPKAALKNVSRPRNRFAHEKQIIEQAANKTAAATLKSTAITTTAKDNSNPNRDWTITDLQALLNNGLLKATNVSQFALALAHALTQVGQITPQSSTAKPTTTTATAASNSSTANGTGLEKNNDHILKQLLRSINASQPSNDAAVSSSNYSQWPSTTSMDNITRSKSVDDVRINGHSSHSFSTFNDPLSPLPVTTDATTSALIANKTTCIPQVDGCIDDDDDDLHISGIVIKSLIEQIMNKSDEERPRADSDYSMDLSDYVNTPSVIDMSPISPTHRSNSSTKKSQLIDQLVELYRQWAKSVYGRVKFTITNDDGYRSVSEDLDEAWASIVNLVRAGRDDQNLTHLPLSNEDLNGHRMFGLTKPIVLTTLNQLYLNSSSMKQATTGTIPLPLSSSSIINLPSNISSNAEVINKKHLTGSSRVNAHERKTRERQRFGWLLNQSRKIDYALKSFELDEALAHAKRILLEEASVSLRLYHLHYFSERALLVGSSPIHGCGLFTLVDLVEGQMIIEYTGEVVRPCLTDKRERENEGKGFGCYMFTVDSMHVIDATHRGNKARFINHNCTPNCFAKTVLSGGVKHIVIYALTDIARGSELTYDYSFPEEDVKIPCHCGTSKCRVYLN